MTEGIALPGTPAYEKILDHMIERENDLALSVQHPLWRQGIVASIPNVSPPYVVVYLNADDTVPVNCKFLNTYRPRVNDTVWMVQNGSDIIVIGTTTLPPAQQIYEGTDTAEGYTSSASYTYTMSGTDGPDANNIWMYAGQEASVHVSCQVYTVTTDAWGFMSFEVGGASTLAASDANAAIGQPSDVTLDWKHSWAARDTRYTATNTGLHNFKSFYRRQSTPDAGTVHFFYRRILVTLF